jgi:hypothetical protein
VLVKRHDAGRCNEGQVIKADDLQHLGQAKEAEKFRSGRYASKNRKGVECENSHQREKDELIRHYFERGEER